MPLPSDGSSQRASVVRDRGRVGSGQRACPCLGAPSARCDDWHCRGFDGCPLPHGNWRGAIPAFPGALAYWVIFLAFAGELAWMLYLTSHKLPYLLANWLDVLIVFFAGLALAGADSEWVASHACCVWRRSACCSHRRPSDAGLAAALCLRVGHYRVSDCRCRILLARAHRTEFCRRAMAGIHHGGNGGIWRSCPHHDLGRAYLPCSLRCSA